MNGFWQNKRVILTGGAGFLGRRVADRLLERGVAKEWLIAPRSHEFDVRSKEAAHDLVQGAHIVIHLAATVGGIAFNHAHPGAVFYDNAAMALHLIEESWRAGVEKFVGVGSVVEHPEHVPLPLQEARLWDGYPDPINASYALAKRFMFAQSQFYRQEFGFNAIHLMPVKLYGPGMRVDPESGQVVAALIAKIIEAKRAGKKNITVWGSGKATREFLFVEDAAEAIVLAAERYDGDTPVNVGTGKETTIQELAEILCRLLDFHGEILWDSTKPEGQLRSVCDVTRAKELFQFSAATPLEEGLRKTIDWYTQYYG